MGIDPLDRLVAIHPSSSCPSKRWPAGSFARVADRLIEEYNIKIVLVSSPDGKIYSKRVKDGMRKTYAWINEQVDVPVAK